MSLAIVALGLATGGVACSDEEADAPAVLEQVSPTKAQIAEAAELVFPTDAVEFRVVRISGSNVNVTFRATPEAVDEFVSASKLELTPGTRVIIHASPIWDLNPGGSLAGGRDTVNGVRRDVEVVSPDEAAPAGGAPETAPTVTSTDQPIDTSTSVPASDSGLATVRISLVTG